MTIHHPVVHCFPSADEIVVAFGRAAAGFRFLRLRAYVKRVKICFKTSLRAAT